MKTTDLALEIGKRVDYLMDCQAMTGVKFDIEAAHKLYEYCVAEMKRIEEEVEPQLPECELNKGDLKDVTPPARQMKMGKNGLIPSSYSEKFFDTIKCVDDTFIGTKDGIEVALPCANKPLYTHGPMKLKHQAKLKDWLVTQGWRPTLWNFKKENGKFVRENGKLVKTSPKFHEMGNLCPNLEMLGAKIALIKPIVRWLSLRNRRSVIWNPDNNSGWLANDRLKVDGRLCAGRGGLAASLRQKHHTVVNVPRPGSVLGEEMRSLFIADEGNVIVGYDASGLEARVEAHYTYRYDGGEYAKELLEGDIHSKTAKAMFGEDIPVDEDGKVVGEFRNPAKGIKYALTYGCSPAKLADMVDEPIERAKEMYQDFWDANWPLAKFKENLIKHWNQLDKKGVYCYVTGNYLHSRSEHSLVNLVFQHTGASAMDISCMFMDKWLGGLLFDQGVPYYLYKGYVIKRVIYMHDEIQWECSPEIADEIGELGVKSIKEAGKYLKLNVDLDGEYLIGKNWCETH